MNQFLGFLIPRLHPVTRQRLFGLHSRQTLIEGAQVVANLRAYRRVVHAELEVFPCVLIKLAESVPDRLRLLDEPAKRIRRIVGPNSQEPGEDLPAVSRRLREWHQTL